jgi:hypothetical protein
MCYLILVLFLHSIDLNLHIAFFYPLTNKVAKGYSNATVLPEHPCEHSSMDFDQTWYIRWTKRTFFQSRDCMFIYYLTSGLIIIL